MKVNYYMMPSLEHIAVTNLAVELWKKELRNGWDLVRDYNFSFPLNKNLFYFLTSERMNKWKEKELKVDKKVETLPLPNSMKYKIKCLVNPVGWQIQKWLEYHNEILNSNLADKLCWTPQGIDKKKTAEALIKDGNLGICKSYELACVYCLENDIKVLWDKMPGNMKKLFHNEKSPRYIRQQELVLFWTYFIKGEVTKLDDIIKERWRRCATYQYAFEYAAVSSKAATEYFLQKLTPEEREESLVRTVIYAIDRNFTPHGFGKDFSKIQSDVLLFLLSQMNEDQQKEVFESNSYRILLCLLEWPWQNSFIEVSKSMWQFLSDTHFCNLLLAIYRKVQFCDKNYDYQNLFEEFWKQSPEKFKAGMINSFTSIMKLLSILFRFGDQKNIAFILKYATVAEKEALVFSNTWKKSCIDNIFDCNWNSIKFFISECLSDKEKIIKIKTEILEHDLLVISNENSSHEKALLDRFCNILDDLIENADKKGSMKEETIHPAKRLRIS